MSTQVRPHRLLAALAFVLALACLRAPVPTPPSRATLQVDVISVGRGDAILVSSPTGKRLLIDGGEAEAAPAVLAVLRQRGACPLDLILLTHRHADHLGGLKKVVEGCGVRLFMDSGYPHASALYARLLDALEKHHVPLYQAQSGREIELGGGAVLTLLGPPQPFIEKSVDSVNANSVVSRLQMGRTSVLFTGDAEAQAEKRLLEGAVALGSTVLKIGHHGSRTSSTREFLHAVSPRLALVSNAAGDVKHPHPETLERLRGVRVLQTAQEGTIHLDLDGEVVRVRTVIHPQQERMP
jgi:beta-lactamase superfamily II metal-dependent hydrolase